MAIPISPNALFPWSFGAPDFVSLVPAAGYRSVDYESQLVLDLSLSVPGASPPESFVLP